MKRSWLFVEALALSLPTTLLLAAGLPIAARSAAFIGTVADDWRALFDSLLALLPYLCGLFAWLMTWVAVFKVAAGERLHPDGWFWVVLAAGFVASLDFLVAAPQLLRLLVCLPAWMLAAHLMLLGVHPQTQRGPQLA